MSSIATVTASVQAGAAIAQDDMQSLLTVDPSAVQAAAGFDTDDDEPFGKVTEPKPYLTRGHVKANWLDALAASDRHRTTDNAVPAPVKMRIASVNSDDNGLYRMFIGVSP